jgi:hypothetical protein
VTINTHEEVIAMNEVEEVLKDGRNNINDKFLDTKQVNIINQEALNTGDCIKVRINSNDGEVRNVIVRYTDEEGVHCIDLNSRRDSKTFAILAKYLANGNVEILDIMREGGNSRWIKKE